MTTITNPTDDELNKLFALHICNWTPRPHPAFPNGPIISWRDGDGVMKEVHSKLRFTESIDAVLPWLMQQNEFRVYGGQYCTAHCVVVTQFDRIFEQVADTTPKACVLALLKAHGVEVVYKNNYLSTP